jgi:hypothetical protein
MNQQHRQKKLQSAEKHNINKNSNALSLLDPQTNIMEI